MYSYRMLLQISVLMLVSYSSGLDPLVKTNVGLIKGLKATNGDYSMFLGIPYAAVDPENPFGPASPHPPFNTTFKAYDDSTKCPQYDFFSGTGIGVINCLRLNINVPNSATSDNLLPVMIFIHGGGFDAGYVGRKQFGAKYLVRHDVILITINYRVGVYGFMCLGTPEVPGNQGLKDQILAFKWVKANIKSFGGDPDRVTIFGQSAGGRSVDFHLMDDKHNLFSKAIFESGNSMSPPGIGEVNTELPIALSKQLGFETSDFREAVTFLKTVDPKAIVTIADNLGWVFQACVEKEIEGVDRFIPDYTINRNVTKVKTIPILMGFTKNERYYRHIYKYNNYYKGLDFFGEYLKNYFTFDKEKLNELTKLVQTFYIGDEELSVDVKQEISDFDSDFKYIHPTHRRALKFVSNGAKNVYYYMFSYMGGRNYFSKRKDILVGAIHADELMYLFDDEENNEKPSQEDQLMIDKMTTMWTNFAKYGTPTPMVSDLLPVKWEPISKSKWYCYNIDKELTLERRPFNLRMAFLDLFFKMNEQFQKGYRKIG